MWIAFCSFSLFDDDICFSRGWQGLIAYGCHSLVLIVDANTAQTLQVLERHKSSVVKVRCTCFKVYYLISVYILFFKISVNTWHYIALDFHIKSVVKYVYFTLSLLQVNQTIHAEIWAEVDTFIEGIKYIEGIEYIETFGSVIEHRQKCFWESS